MTKPLVVIVGRPNVGKSTLFNRMTGTHTAIVEDIPGVTRDRNYLDAVWEGKTYLLVDTGGFYLDPPEDIFAQAKEQALFAIEEGDIIIHLLDGKEGLTPSDMELARLLRASGKRVLWAVNKIDAHSRENRLYEFYHIGTEDLYPEVGFGKMAPRQILSALFPDVSPLTEEKAKPSPIAAVVQKVLGRGESPITVKGQDGLLVYRAKCCNPIRGDEVVGYITRGKGISVHTTACPNVSHFLGSERLTDVEWLNVPGDELFSVRLAISVEDRQGILAEITSAISNLKTNIRESRSSTDGGKGLVEVTIEIHDTKHLQKVVQVLKSIRGIQDVDRVGKAV